MPEVAALAAEEEARRAAGRAILQEQLAKGKVPTVIAEDSDSEGEPDLVIEVREGKSQHEASLAP